MKTKLFHFTMIAMSVLGASFSLLSLYVQGWPLWSAWLWIGLWAIWLALALNRHIRKLMSVAFLAFCFSATAAPMPPLPVARPVPALSPKHASQPKAGKMFKPASVPFTEPAPGRMTITIKNGINFYGCDTNVPGCQLYYQEQVKILNHPAGTEMLLGFAGEANATTWIWAARFGVGPVDRVGWFTQFKPEWQQGERLFYKSWFVVPILPASRSKSAEPVNIVNPALGPLATARSEKK